MRSRSNLSHVSRHGNHKRYKGLTPAKFKSNPNEKPASSIPPLSIWATPSKPQKKSWLEEITEKLKSLEGTDEDKDLQQEESIGFTK